MTSSKEDWEWLVEMDGLLLDKREIIVTGASIFKLPSWLTGATAEQRGSAAKSRGPLTERNPLLSGYRGRSPSPGGSDCGAPSVSNETRLNSDTASGVPATLVGGCTADEKQTGLRFLLAVKKKNLHVIHDQSCACCYVI